jgi:hypothetical protein
MVSHAVTWYSSVTAIRTRNTTVTVGFKSTTFWGGRGDACMPSHKTVPFKLICIYSRNAGLKYSLEVSVIFNSDCSFKIGERQNNPTGFNKLII